MPKGRYMKGPWKRPEELGISGTLPILHQLSSLMTASLPCVKDVWQYWYIAASDFHTCWPASSKRRASTRVVSGVIIYRGWCMSQGRRTCSAVTRHATSLFFGSLSFKNVDYDGIIENYMHIFMEHRVTSLVSSMLCPYLGK
jgi:hypothetical protein